MYSVHTAFAAQRWRQKHGPSVRRWLEAVAELEALISLGTYRYEHPDDPFPEILASDATPSFEAIQISHPLLPAAVRNDVTLGRGLRAIIISGSNMSGKSTLMRSVGVNTVLAMAGAPVRAKSLRLSPLQVGASIRINDSLQEGSSRFYAEIQRLRQLFDAGKELPLLFLLDEVLQGTNSHDRKVGATGILRALLERGAIGMLSTHDLALTELSQLRPGEIVNMHFADEIEDGKMRFDYHLRAGVVTKSNGLELMRSVGLEV
jgi:DNA mismatch repair ATPase MutS